MFRISIIEQNSITDIIAIKAIGLLRKNSDIAFTSNISSNLFFTLLNLLSTQNRTAVDIQNLARDVPRPIGKEKTDRKSNIVGHCHSFERN